MWFTATSGTAQDAARPWTTGYICLPFLPCRRTGAADEELRGASPRASRGEHNAALRVRPTGWTTVLRQVVQGWPRVLPPRPQRTAQETSLQSHRCQRGREYCKRLGGGLSEHTCRWCTYKWNFEMEVRQTRTCVMVSNRVLGTATYRMTGTLYNTFISAKKMSAGWATNTFDETRHHNGQSHRKIILWKLFKSRY